MEFSTSTLNTGVLAIPQGTAIVVTLTAMSFLYRKIGHTNIQLVVAMAGLCLFSGLWLLETPERKALALAMSFMQGRYSVVVFRYADFYFQLFSSPMLCENPAQKESIVPNVLFLTGWALSQWIRIRFVALTKPCADLLSSWLFRTNISQLVLPSSTACVA